MTLSPNHYGDELTLRVGEVHRRAALADQEAIIRFLVSLVRNVGMTVIGGPVVARESGPAHRAGVSGVVILAESHAAVHTYPYLGQLFFNLFSCKPFDEATVLTEIGHLAGAFTITERTLIRRGEDWPRDPHAAARHWRTIVGPPAADNTQSAVGLVNGTAPIRPPSTTMS